VVGLCQAAGLVWGRELFFDATKVRATADVDSLVPRLSRVVGDHLEALFPPVADPHAPGPGPSPAAEEAAGRGPAVAALPTAGRADPAAAPPAWSLLDTGRLDPDRPASGSYHRFSDARVSRTDPDAALMRVGGRACLGYHDPYVVDGGKARIILAALVTPADVMENQPLLDLLWRVRFRWHVHPQRAVGDTAYGTAENIRALEDAGIRAYVPLPDWDQRTGFYGPSRFAYDPARDEYRCPEGHALRRRTASHRIQAWVYHAPARTCNACPVKGACTASPHGRSLIRSFHTAYLDRVRAYHATEAYKKAMPKRGVWVEPLFGEPCSGRPSNGTACASSASAASRR
jgi:hypothetical protein